MNFEFLCRQYELGEFQTAAPLNPGTASQVWRLETDCGSFLVRTLSGTEQGEREFAVIRHLLSRGFGDFPLILLTANGAPFLEWEGCLYQVQRLLTGTMPHPARPGVAAAMAQLAKKLAAALADYPGGPVIHGDLGPWNLLQQEDGQLAVIDFGESKPGDPYFDYATLFAGVINHIPPEQREAVCREFLSELDCDRHRLLTQLRLWAEQGVRQWTGRSEKMVSRFHHALNWAEENLYDL